MRRITRQLLGWTGCVVVAATPASGQAIPDSAPRTVAPVFSIGQPPQWNQYAAAMAALGGHANGIHGNVTYGLHHPIFNPVGGLLGAAAEGYLDVGGRASPGIRVLATTRALGLAGGIDWNTRGGGIRPLFSLQSAIRRGGLLGHGSMVRIDWLPTDRQGVEIGITVPTFEPLAGRTRPRQTQVRLGDGPGSLPPVAKASLDRVSAAVSNIAALTNAYSRGARETIVRTAGLAARPDGGRYARAIKEYQSALVDAFATSTADSALARAAVRRGRRALFDRVVLPIDSLFGQAKEHARDLSPLTSRAASDFERWVRDSSGVRAAAGPTLLAVYVSWLDVVSREYDRLVADADDSRLVWLPLELALTPEQYDEQAEVDSLIARAVGHPFTDRNELTYLRSADLPLEIARSIYATRDYHVLWTHDFRGRGASGEIDNVGFSIVADAYLPALTAAVKRYDSTGVIPTYIILLDQYFYESNDGRLWMTMLEDPLHASMHIPNDDDGDERESQLRRRQQELRAAVGASTRLQRDAAASGKSETWLRKVVRVHVNITNPSDFSFRSSHSVPPIPFTPDNVMRDHRKIVFYDLNEADSYRGAMLLMGVGVGEHYTSATWEDRGYRLRGPAALEVRRAARDELQRNGFAEADIPAPLREVASAPAAERQMNIGDYVGRALQVNNDVGFGEKESSVARAMLYNLAPPGSLIIVPDPMWTSRTWAGMLIGAALRGCRVYIIAPAHANAPSPQAPLMVLARDVLGRLIDLRRELGPEIQHAGGDLRVGVFAAQAQVDDVAGRAREVREGLARAPWIRSVVPFDAKTLAVLDRAEATAETQGPDGTSLGHDDKPRLPQLHQKTQLIARPGAISALVRQPGWDDVLARTMRAQSQETARFAKQLGWSTPDVDTAAIRSADALLRGYEQSLPESERRQVSFYFSLGSQNQDERGIVMDGETTLIVSGIQASAGLVDLYYLMARSQWVDSEEALNRYLPQRSSLLRRIARLIRAAL